jgi:hypothetical protein
MPRAMTHLSEVCERLPAGFQIATPHVPVAPGRAVGGIITATLLREILILKCEKKLPVATLDV